MEASKKETQAYKRFRFAGDISKMNTAIYIRTSTTEQTPELQLKGCKQINKFGDAVIYKDQQSAWKDHVERPGFNDLRKGIKSRKIDHIIVWDLDRIYRNRKKLIDFFQFCKAFRCKIHSYNQSWLNELNDIPSPFDEIMHDLMLQIMGWIAEEESNKKSERVKMAIDKRSSITKSRYGKKWGRKQISTQKKKKILELKKQGLTTRTIAKEVGVGIGTVSRVCS